MCKSISNAPYSKGFKRRKWKQKVEYPQEISFVLSNIGRFRQKENNLIQVVLTKAHTFTIPRSLHSITRHKSQTRVITSFSSKISISTLRIHSVPVVNELIEWSVFEGNHVSIRKGKLYNKS